MIIPEHTFIFTTPAIDTSRVIVILLAVVALMCLALAYRTWIGNKRHPSNIFYAVTVVMVMFWILSHIGIRLADDPVYISLFVRLGYSFGALIVFFFYIFTYHFAFKRFLFTKKHYILLVSSTLFILLISIIPGIAVPGQVLPENRFDPENTFWNIVFTVYYIVLVVLAFKNLLVKHKQIGGIWKLRLKQLMVGTSLPLLTGVIFGLIVPIFWTIELEWITVLCVGYMAVYIWYQIFWKTGHITSKKHISY